MQCRIQPNVALWGVGKNAKQRRKQGSIRRSKTENQICYQLCDDGSPKGWLPGAHTRAPFTDALSLPPGGSQTHPKGTAVERAEKFCICSRNRVKQITRLRVEKEHHLRRDVRREILCAPRAMAPEREAHRALHVHRSSACSKHIASAGISILGASHPGSVDHIWSDRTRTFCAGSAYPVDSFGISTPEWPSGTHPPPRVPTPDFQKVTEGHSGI